MLLSHIMFFSLFYYYHYFFLLNVADSDPKPGTVMNTIISNIDLVDTELHSEEKGSTVLMPKNRKKTMTSVYLKYFETAQDGKSRRCKICGQSYSIATATG